MPYCCLSKFKGERRVQVACCHKEWVWSGCAHSAEAKGLTYLRLI